MFENGVIIIQQNIWSLRKNFDLFTLKLHSLNKLPDVIILSEIWTDDSEITLYKIRKFNSIAKCNNSY